MMKNLIQPLLKNIIFMYIFWFSSALAQATFPSPLIDGQSLLERLDDVILLDVRSENDYANAHIVGAVHSPYKNWRVNKGGVVGLIPGTDHVQNLIQKAGIGKTSSVVVVFGNVKGSDFGSAARVYWTLKTAGITDIAILDGGFQKWKEAGYAISVEPVTPQPSSFTIERFDHTYFADADTVQALQSDQGTLLLDARPDQQYQGYQKHPQSKYGGTIPTAQQFSQFNVFAKDGTILDRATLQKFAQDLNLDDKKHIVSFCNTGHWAATNWFVFSELLGYEIKLYDGSMVDWTHKNLEVANQKNRFELWWHEINQ